MKNLTSLQKRILSAMPADGFILLRDLAGHLDGTSNQVRIQVRKLELLGFLFVEKPTYYNSPMHIKLAREFTDVKPDFNKLIMNTKWV